MKHHFAKRFKAGIIFTGLLFALIGMKSNAQEVKIVTMTKYYSNCLYNFSRYINWPAENKSGTFIITIVGNKDLYTEMSNLTRNMKVGLQAIEVKYISTVNELSGFQHIVFLDNWQSSKINLLLQKVSGQHTLVVTETEGMTFKGAMINFISVDGMMQFEMNPENLRKSNLMASSVLEKMARNAN
jgi:hypothetical protein